MEQLTQDQKAIIFISLRAGDGLSIACRNAGADPKMVSEHIIYYPSFYDECMRYISAGIASLLQKRQMHLEEGNYDAVAKIDAMRERFIDRLTTWGSSGLSVLTADINLAIHVYKRPEEAATAYGLTYDAFMAYKAKRVK